MLATYIRNEANKMGCWLDWKTIGPFAAACIMRLYHLFIHVPYVNRCGEVYPSDVEFHQNFCEKLKKGLHGPDALHELEMLVANLICVHAKLTRDDPKIDRYIAIDWLGTN